MIGGCENSQTRRKQKELDPLIAIESDNSRKDRKWRVVNHDALFWIVMVLVIAARKERPDVMFHCNTVFLRHPFCHRIVYHIRCVAVIGGLLLLKLVQKFVIFIRFVFRVVVESVLP